MLGAFLAFQVLGLLTRFWVTGTILDFPDESAAVSEKWNENYFGTTGLLCIGIGISFIAISIFDYFFFTYHPL